MPPKKLKSTKSTASKKLRQEIDYLASVSSPPKSSKTKNSLKNKHRSSRQNAKRELSLKL